MKNIALIGSTGSIGRQLLEVVKRYNNEFRVVAMCAARPSKEFERQRAEFVPELCALASEDVNAALAVAEYPSADIVFNAAGGFAGLKYSLKAVAAGKPLALANKESLVCGGQLLMPLAARVGVEIIPVDSEHSAIWQCLGFNRQKSVRRLIITASGGAFKGKKFSELSDVTPSMALNHPTWKMGAKITVDSTTLANKGYEVIEAHMLYGVPYKKIETVIQPQSIIHSLVEFEDGAVFAQMSNPTMELPIQLALTYPDRLPSCVPPMDFKKAFSLDFEPLERQAYPMFDLALKAAEEGGAAPCIYNAADEVAVNAFLQGKISFPCIYAVVSHVLNKMCAAPCDTYASLAEKDIAARAEAEKYIKNL